ncbi:hypothetical protein [Tenacibaculum discolor]|uniref:hypothetical protein n=1 Tax=Tenacibaculum discolor TaxID=361581 RepID=UPI00159BAE0C|nr:hypothetical protein [Tenacibaculum discolor]
MKKEHLQKITLKETTTNNTYTNVNTTITTPDQHRTHTNHTAQTHKRKQIKEET